MTQDPQTKSMLVMSEQMQENIKAYLLTCREGISIVNASMTVCFMPPRNTLEESILLLSGPSELLEHRRMEEQRQADDRWDRLVRDTRRPPVRAPWPPRLVRSPVRRVAPASTAWSCSLAAFR